MFFAIWLMFGWPLLHAADEPPFGLDHRIPWTTSRVIGSPEPPLPYTVEKTFTNIQWQQPIFITAESGTDRLFVIQQNGETNRPARVLRLRDDPNTAQVETFLAISNRLVYSFAFHPGYRTNGYIYLFSNGPTPETNRLNRISRFTVGRQPPQPCDPKTEQVILEWRSMGHDGGGLVFGQDGMLYISSGDGSGDSDTWATGQDLSDLNGGILRINVDQPDGTRPYSVPKDNPFIGLKDARPENWAYGLRNPWRLTIDQKTGQIWVGSNGQDLWETAHLMRRGENYGWSVYEGSHPFYLNRKLGPTPVVLPTIEHSHSEARSLTGGVVYYGHELSELDGVYIYGDYSTGKIWGARHDGKRVTWRQELASTELLITAFAVDQRGRMLIADHAGNIFRLIRAPKQISKAKFPTRLSETGLFRSTKAHQVQPGVIPYSVNAPGWADGASAERFIALPGDTRIGYASSGGWNFTNGAVLVQTLSLEREAGNPASRQRIETRLLVFQGGQWAGYSYRWNDAQSDATLVRKTGDEKEFVIHDRRATGGVRRQVWRFPSRAECSACHSRAANFVLGMSESQMNRVHDYDGVKDNQLRTLEHIGLFTNALPKPPAELTKQVDPYHPSESLEARARSYLHANCSVCHVGAGGGNSKMILSLSTKLEEMNVIGARPQHDTFGIADAMLIAPGDPDRSILYQRLSRRGRGQMPPVVVSTADEKAIALVRDWIRSLKPEHQFVRDWKMENLLPSLDKVKAGRSFESGKAAFKQAGCGQCHRFTGEVGSVGPDLTGVGKRLALHDLMESIVLPSKVIAEGFAATEIETKSDEITNGRIVREDDQVVVVLPQTAIAEAVTIRKRDIRRRELSKVSNMPAGILNTLQEAQVLDLLAYLISDGNSNHVAFVSGAVANPAAK
ncbi:MAG: PQQ-dependent sugar dehydrogenase [Verrucomicrobia bacterium]|nr:PQQ-dependent sugar dehydrogenase [Verrucomicrobiota bacterium]